MSSVLQSRMELLVEDTVRYTDSDASSPDRYKYGSGQLPEYKRVFTEGTSAEQAQLHYHKAHTLAAAGSVTIDLNAAVTERFGTLDFTNIKRMIFRLRSAALTYKAVVGNASADPWAPFLSSATATFDVWGLLVWDNPFTGWTVPSAANIKINNPNAGSIIVDVSLMGH